jgi:hypothetical protein
MAAIRHYGLVPIAKQHFQTKGRFWRRDPLGLLRGRAHLRVVWLAQGALESAERVVREIVGHD